MKKNDGGPAFPTGIVYTKPHMPGMSLRDWFAGMALQGFCANADLHGKEQGTWIGDATARDAYSYADAMLQERDKEE